MPQKPNRSGQLQNYVPAGNGDASGEYGDNESGSNIHFKVFKRPEDTTPVKNNEIKQEDYDSAVDYLDKSLRDYDEFRKTNKEVKLGYHVAHDYDKENWAKKPPRIVNTNQHKGTQKTYLDTTAKFYNDGMVNGFKIYDLNSGKPQLVKEARRK